MISKAFLHLAFDQSKFWRQKMDQTSVEKPTVPVTALAFVQTNVRVF